MFDNNIYKHALYKSLAFEEVKDDFAKALKQASKGNDRVTIDVNNVFGSISSFSNSGALNLLLENSIIAVDTLKINGDFNQFAINSNVYVQNMYNIIKTIIETKTVEVEKIKEISTKLVDLVRDEENKSGALFFNRKIVIIFYNGNTYINKSCNTLTDVVNFIYDNGIHNIFTENSLNGKSFTGLNRNRNSMKNIFNLSYTFDIFKKGDQYLLLLNMQLLKTKKMETKNKAGEKITYNMFNEINVDDDLRTSKIPMQYFHENAPYFFESKTSDYLFGKKSDVQQVKQFLGLIPKLPPKPKLPPRKKVNPILGDVKKPVKLVKSPSVVFKKDIPIIEQNIPIIEQNMFGLENIQNNYDYIIQRDLKQYDYIVEIDDLNDFEEDEYYYNALIYYGIYLDEIITFNKRAITPLTQTQKKYLETLANINDAIIQHFNTKYGDEEADKELQKVIQKAIKYALANTTNFVPKLTQIEIDKLSKLKSNLLF